MFVAMRPSLMPVASDVEPRAYQHLWWRHACQLLLDRFYRKIDAAASRPDSKASYVLSTASIGTRDT